MLGTNPKVLELQAAKEILAEVFNLHSALSVHPVIIFASVPQQP